MESWGNGGDSLDESMEESEEYRLLEAYCNRRTQQRFPIMHQGPVDSKNQDHAQFSGKHMGNLIVRARGQCEISGSTLPFCRVTEHLVQIADSAQIHEDDDLESDGTDDGSTLPFRRVTEHLVQIADSAQIHEDDDLESDGTDDDVIKELVELLKKSGDELDEKIKKDKALQQKIQKSLSYSLFEKVTTSILDSLVAPSGCAGAVPYKQQIAWACEVTHRLSAVDCIPRRRALVFGTQYIQQHLSAWVQQQGGWDSVFEDVD